MDAVEKLVSGNLQDALRVARSYGVEALESVLPAMKPVEITSSDLMGATSESLRSQASQTVQMKALLILAASLEAGAGLDQLMRLLLEGIHKSIGFDRTYFALCIADRKALAGEVHTRARRSIVFSVAAQLDTDQRFLSASL